MTMQNIHDGQYIAEYGETARGPILVITRPKGGGKYIEGAQAEHWAEEITTALDKSEANALCRAIINEH